MKNIIKNSIIMVLIGLVSVVSFAPMALAAGPNPSPMVVPSISGVSATSITQTSATLNATINPNGMATAAWFDTSGGNCTSNCGNVGGIMSTQTITFNLTGLTANTSYSFTANAFNGSGPATPVNVNFTTASAPAPTPPSLSGVSASAITTTSATLNGTVNPNGSPTAAWFDTSGGNCTSNCGNVGGINSTTTLTYNLTGLTPNTQYSFQMLAMNSGGPAISSTINFTTGSVSGGSAPAVVTNVASSISKNSAVLNGDYDDNGASTSTWFEWGPTVALGNSTASTVQPSSTGFDPFSDSLSGLTPSTIYFYRAMAQNANGPAPAGMILSFTTSNASSNGGGGGGGSSNKPSVTTKDATSVTVSGAVLNGSIIPKNTTTRWFQWGTSANALSNSTPIVNQSASGDVKETISGLQSATTYYFRLVGSNSNAVVYGNTLSFKTAGIPANSLQAVTALASSVGQTTAKINGLVLNAGTGADVWFEYGRTVSLGYSTVIKSASGASTDISNVLGNLAPNIIYFFRIVAKNDAGIVKGEIKIFKTLASTVAPVTVDENTGSDENLVSLKIEAAPQTVAPEETVNYTVTYKNLSGKVLKDVVVRVVLPSGIDFANSSIGNYEDADRTLSANIGSLEANQEGIITLSGTVSKDAADKDILVTTASIVFTNGNAQGDALDYALVDIAVNQNLLPAAAFFGSGFLPSTLLGWMVLILVALGLVMLGRKIYAEVNWANALVSIKNTFKK